MDSNPVVDVVVKMVVTKAAVEAMVKVSHKIAIVVVVVDATAIKVTGVAEIKINNQATKTSPMGIIRRIPMVKVS